MYSCHSILECFGLFSGVKLSIRSFVLLPIFNCLENMTEKAHDSFHGLIVRMNALGLKTNLKFNIYLKKFTSNFKKIENLVNWLLSNHCQRERLQKFL